MSNVNEINIAITVIIFFIWISMISMTGIKFKNIDWYYLTLDVDNTEVKVNRIMHTIDDMGYYTVSVSPIIDLENLTDKEKVFYLENIVNSKGRYFYKIISIPTDDIYVNTINNYDDDIKKIRLSRDIVLESLTPKRNNIKR